MIATAGAFPLREYDPRIGSRAFAHTTDGAMKLFVELRVLDPLTFGSLSLQLWHVTMLDAFLTVGDNTLSLPANAAIRRESRVFDGLMTAMKPLYPRVHYDQAPGLRLGPTLERFEKLVGATEELHRHFEAAGLRFQMGSDIYESRLTAAEQELSSLKARHKLLTPQHLALQDHFEHFVGFSTPIMGLISLHRAEALYGPLAALRDEYFTSPSPPVLQRYLEVTGTIEQTDDFARLRESQLIMRKEFRSTVVVSALDAADARLPELETELEVFALLDEEEGGVR